MANLSLYLLESNAGAKVGIVDSTGMLKIESKPDAEGIVRLTLAGRMNANSLGELRRAIDRARRHRGRVALDLSEITLADRASLDFLAQQSKEQIELINCPSYLASWIARA
ncbi:MAG: hypothetical protein JWO19_3072 [Bryobacterales bacterium]|nr:hypothetical protein [Bryobacterales bacterium]